MKAVEWILVAKWLLQKKLNMDLHVVDLVLLLVEAMVNIILPYELGIMNAVQH